MKLEAKKEFNKGLLVMLFVFVWGMIIMSIISALLHKLWLWYLSIGLVPIIAFLSALVYDIRATKIPDVDVVEKEIWEELDLNHIIVIDQAEPLIEKVYEGRWQAKL